MTTTTRTEDTAADDPVVITGIGAITPLGNTADQTWDCLLNGRSGVGPITQFDASTFTTRIAAEVKGFDPAEHLKLKDLKRTSRATQLAVVAAREAVADAGLPESLSEFDGITATSAGASDETSGPGRWRGERRRVPRRRGESAESLPTARRKPETSPVSSSTPPSPASPRSRRRLGHSIRKGLGSSVRCSFPPH
jgi:hypothetical protein